jgi:hypothetical protein
LIKPRKQPTHPPAVKLRAVARHQNRSVGHTKEDSINREVLIMNVRDIRDTLSRDARRKEREKALQKKAEAAGDYTADAVRGVFGKIEGVHGKTDGVKRDMKEGFHDIDQNIHKTARKVSSEVKGASK